MRADLSVEAIIAVAASTLTAVYWMLKRGVAYADLGANHFDRTELISFACKLGELGCDVTVVSREAA